MNNVENLTQKFGEASEFRGISEFLCVEGNGALGRQGDKRPKGVGEADVAGRDTSQQNVRIPLKILSLSK